MSDFEAIGGEVAVKEAVERFYARVFDDEQLAPYFVGVDQRKLKQHQATLVAQLLGGPQRYDGRTLGEAHAHLGVTQDDFDRVVGHFASVLRELGVDEPAVSRAGAALCSYQPEIVQDGTPARDGSTVPSAGAS